MHGSYKNFHFGLYKTNNQNGEKFDKKLKQITVLTNFYLCDIIKNEKKGADPRK